jgi:hypothetical protein
MHRRCRVSLFLLVALFGCSGTSRAAQSASAKSAASATRQHVFVVVEENQSYADVIGSPSMPYLNSLARKYGLATRYYANTHPSIGNYFMLTTGQIITNSDHFSGIVRQNNLVRVLTAAGKTWKSYAEALPSVGYTEDDAYPYRRRHNPFAYFSDVLENPAQQRNLVPFSQFAEDLAADRLPDYSFIIPNLRNDLHDGSQQQADQWLRDNLSPLIASTTFQESGLLLIVFDESRGSDRAHGGGHIPVVVVSARVKPGFRSRAFYQHQSALRLTLETLGIRTLLGAAEAAPAMRQFFR